MCVWCGVWCVCVYVWSVGCVRVVCACGVECRVCACLCGV